MGGLHPSVRAGLPRLGSRFVEGLLLVCPVVFAEIAPGRPDSQAVTRDLEQLGIHYDSILPDTAYLAGQIHLKYRREGGPRKHMIPDFLIAAHAQVQADRLAAVDRGYLRRYFPNLSLLEPG